MPTGPLKPEVVSRQRWEAARNSEQRQRESAKRARELMRMRQRDRKMEVETLETLKRRWCPKDPGMS